MAHQPLLCTGAEGPGPGAYLPGQLLLLHAEDVCEALHAHLQQLGSGVQAVPVLLQVLRVGWGQRAATSIRSASGPPVAPNLCTPPRHYLFSQGLVHMKSCACLLRVEFLFLSDLWNSLDQILLFSKARYSDDSFSDQGLQARVPDVGVGNFNPVGEPL